MFKKSLSTSILFVVFINVSSALSQFGIGLNGGLNHSSLDISDPAEIATYVPRNGFIIGAISRYSLSEKYYISAQLRFIEKGQEVEWSEPLEGDYTEVQLNYLEVPIHFNYQMNFNTIKPNIFCGVYFGYLLKATGTIKTDNEIFEFDQIDQFEKFDFGLDIGVGLDFNLLDNYDLFFDFCYSHGLTHINQYYSAVKNKGFQFTVGFIYYINSTI